MLAPKMEHQLEFGAEAITFEEVSHQWASLICRPATLLARGIILQRLYYIQKTIFVLFV